MKKDFNTYSKGQNNFIQAALLGNNIFLSGKAGTGKSYIVKELISLLQRSGKKVICMAPTGIAAINIGGQTIHSLFSMKTEGIMDFKNAGFLTPIKRDVIKNCDTIIIDEVSMLRCDILDGIHYTMKKNRIGGLKDKQIIFIGDLKQLPVVVDKNTEAILFAEGYNNTNFLNAKIYNSLNILQIELDEVIRQKDPVFIQALNIIRDGGKSDYFKKFVTQEPKGIVLAPHNATVQKYNVKGLQESQGKEYSFKARYEGICTKNDFGFEDEIKVKNGCPIMYLVNAETNSVLRNGTIGKFYMIDGTPTIDVHGIKYPMQPHKAVKKEYTFDQEKDEMILKEVGSCYQYPFKLAFALSIHKSQGLTFDEVTVDLTRRCFMAGQMYVALSRVRTPNGLRILV